MSDSVALHCEFSVLLGGSRNFPEICIAHVCGVSVGYPVGVKLKRRRKAWFLTPYRSETPQNTNDFGCGLFCSRSQTPVWERLSQKLPLRVSPRCARVSRPRTPLTEGLLVRRWAGLETFGRLFRRGHLRRARVSPIGHRSVAANKRSTSWPQPARAKQSFADRRSQAGAWERAAKILTVFVKEYSTVNRQIPPVSSPET